MTRETKIGLLVGLAFLIVIGILLSDHYRGANEPPRAPLIDVAPNVREAVNSPGTGSEPPVTIITPRNVEPEQVVTQEEMKPPASPITFQKPGESNSAAAGDNGSSNGVNNGSTTSNGSNTQANGAGSSDSGSTSTGGASADNGTPAGMNSLAQVARANGEDITTANGSPANNGSTSGSNPGASATGISAGNDANGNSVSNPSDGSAGIANATASAGSTLAATPAGFISYTAKPGDSVSRMAARFLLKNNRANREAIINANPALKVNKDRVIIGKTYLIPKSLANATALAAAGAGSNATSGASATDTSASSAPSGSNASSIAASTVASTTADPAAANNGPMTASGPTAGSGLTTGNASTAGNAASADAGSTAASADANVYVVKPGDSLWKIAKNELGSPSAIDAIKELNKDVLKGQNHDIVIVGATLKMPARIVASTN